MLITKLSTFKLYVKEKLNHGFDFVVSIPPVVCDHNMTSYYISQNVGTV